MTGPAPDRAPAPMAGRGSGAASRMLIAGVGNIFLGDDGFGPEVAKRLAAERLPGWVRVADYGISGMHLAYDLADGYDTAILIDAAPRGGQPGTVTVLDVTAEHRRDLAADEGPVGASRLFDAHGMQPDVVLGVLDMLGAGGKARILVVGCQPASVDYGMELSEPVAKAVDDAVRVVLDLVAEAGHGRQDTATSDGHHDAGTTGGAGPEVPEVPETTGEGASHVPWHSR
jgi:hydrogenase maturation protease